MRYFQPSEQECLDYDIYSFQVWKSINNLLKDFPRIRTINIYYNNEIENPTFMD